MDVNSSTFAGASGRYPRRMNRKRLGAVIVVGLWASVGAIVIACGDDDSANPPATTNEAGVDSSPTSTSTSTSSPPDSGSPDANKPGDAGSDATAEDRAIWAFRAYCGEGIDAGCPDAGECPSYDGGGVAAQECDKPFDRCLSIPNKTDAGIATRVFACESVATPTWQTNRLCAYEPCDNVDAGDCPNFDGGGVDGQECPTPKARCQTKQRVFICQGNGGLFQAFNGYCDAGAGTRACNDEVDACAPVDGGVAGSACDTERARCYAGGDGNKIFVCARR